MYNFLENPVSPQAFIAKLVRAMCLEDAAPEKRKQLEETIEKQMAVIVMKTVSAHAEPEVIMQFGREHAEHTDMETFIREILKKSPETHARVLDALDDFYDQMLDAYATLKH